MTQRAERQWGWIPWFRRAACAVALACIPGGPVVALGEPVATAEPERTWTVRGTFDGKKESENLSGLACATKDAPAGAERPCLLISDERLYARLVTLRDGVLRLGAKVTLLPATEDGDRFRETDAEGVAYDDGAYYVVGSHGSSKKAGEYQRSRFFIYRIPVAPRTGQPTFDDPGGDPPSSRITRTDILEGVLAAVPALAGQACQRRGRCRSLQDGGVNIEGLAVWEGQIYLGLRAPSPGGAAIVVRVPARRVFAGAARDLPASAVTVLRPKIGAGVGIRDLVRVQGGFLILTGPERPEDDGAVGTATVVFWDGAGEAVTPLMALGGMVADAKPEALLVLDEARDAYRVLVLSDGVAGGAPTEYRILRR